MLPGTMLEAGPQGANVRNGPGTQYKVLLAAKPGAAAPATGKEQPVGAKTWYELEVEGRRGWVSSGVVKVRPPADDDDKARIALKAIVTYDKQTYEQGLKILKKLVELQRKGVNVEREKKEFVRIAGEFIARQARIQAKVPGRALDVQKTDGMVAIQAYMKELGINGVGFAAPAVIGIIVSVIIVLVGISKLLGFFKTEYGNSVKNLKESNTLKKALDGLTPAEAEEVRNDLENQIDAGYAQGRKDEKSDAFWTKVKRIGILAAVGLVAVTVVPKMIPERH